ncbi:MAG TPA: glutathione S-transferase family protein [Miltoncostaeaceae bacterium]|nr:glutathione S-transferase family protein [Miltoncostaeaceae bacterium]
MLRLHDNAVSGNCYKVRLILSRLGIPFERIELSVVDRSDREEAIGRAANPALRVPTLQLDDGRHLAESNAILWYFGEGTELVPGDRYERAQVLQWMFFEQYDHEPNLAVARFWLHVLGGAPQGQSLEAKQEGAARAILAMETHLADRTFLVGERFTIADIALYAYTHVAPEGGVPLEPYPAVRAWIDRVAAQPGHITIDE